MIEKMLSAAELAELLGFSPATIVDWSERGTIPSFKVGGRLRFRESEVLTWLEEHRQGSGVTPVTPEEASVRPKVGV